MPRILFLADPNSIHDLKWMRYFAADYPCYLLARKPHLENWTEAQKHNFRQEHNIQILGAIQDFSVRRFYTNNRQWKKIQEHLESLRIEIFHIMYAEPNALWAVYRSRTNGIGWVLTTRGTDILKTIPGHFRKKDLLNRIVAALYQRALNKFNYISSTSKAQVVSLQQLCRNPSIDIIRTGVAISEVLSCTKMHMPEELSGCKYVLFPRNMRPLYNHEFSLAAIRHLSQQIKETYRFVFIDRDSSDTRYVQKVEALMAADKDASFIFLNRQQPEALWELYKRAAVVVMNPLSDGSPVSAMEAMICGTPLILGNLPYDVNLFKGSTLQLNTWDASELANLMQAVLSNTITYDSQLGVQRIKELGDRSKEMERLRQQYLLLCMSGV